ncbi:unnamed protein product [Spirodela intermedia]|uniref:Uncharacterized protein n=1 Tax=Spirodela intermedia TaxID=51605 RepID=A0A7I8KT90_SPIIN|nr:unnamed protein product [Spirodela intermedia]
MKKKQNLEFLPKKTKKKNQNDFLII